MINKKLKIGIISYDYDPPIGGQGVYVKSVTSYLETNQNKYEYLLISTAPSKSRNHKSVKRINNQKIGPIIFAIWANIFAKRWFKKMGGIDILHIQTGAGGIFWLRKTNEPIIATSHFLYSGKLQNSNNPLYKIAFWLEKKTYSLCAKVIATSELMKTKLEEEYNLLNYKVEVIHYSFDPVFKFQKNIKKIKQILFVGRVEAAKRVFELVNIVIALKKKFPDLSFTIVGTGADEDRVKANIRANNAHSFIHLEGFKNKQQLVKYYSESSIFILPTVYEPFGIAAIEALACNTPVIIPENSGLAFTVNKVGWGSSFQDISQISQLIITILAKPPHISSQQVHKLFGKKATCSQLIDLYDQTLKINK
jgi:glycosyltransferase involved in cell wall biosynthesis